MTDITKIKIGDILFTKYGKFKSLENYAGPRFVDIKTDGGYVLLKSIVSIEMAFKPEPEVYPRECTQDSYCKCDYCK